MFFLGLSGMFLGSHDYFYGVELGHKLVHILSFWGAFCIPQGQYEVNYHHSDYVNQPFKEQTINKKAYICILLTIVKETKYYFFFSCLIKIRWNCRGSIYKYAKN